MLNDFFDIENEFDQKFGEDFYFTLNSIKEFETEFDKKILFLDYKRLNYENYKNKQTVSFIKILIFSYLIGQKIPERVLYGKIIELMNLDNNLSNFFSNFELIEILDILFNNMSSNYNIIKNIQIKNNEFLEIIYILIKCIKFEKINKELKPLFSKINWENIFEEKNCYLLILISMINSIEFIQHFEFIFIILDKLIIKEKNNNNKKDEDIKNIINTIITTLLKKYLLILDNIIKNDRKEELILITSKLIYFNYKYQIKNEFIITITEKIESDLLNDILISTFDNFEIDEQDFNNIISTLIEKGKFEKIYYNLLMNNKLIF